MENKKGGYAIIDLTSATLYADLTGAYASGKPVLVYGGDLPFYADTLTLDDDTITLTKGGKTIEVASDGTIKESGSVQTHLYEYFVNYDGENEESSDVVFKFSFKSTVNYTELTTDIIKDYLVDEISIAYENELYNELVLYTGIFNGLLSFKRTNGTEDVISLAILDEITFDKIQLF